MRIFKYEIEVVGDSFIEIPFSAKPLDIQVQNNKIFLWAEIDTEETKTRKFHLKLFGTGHDCGVDSLALLNFEYRKTLQLNNGSLVFHLYTIEKLGSCRG